MGKYLEYVNNKKKKEETESSSSSARFGSGNYGKYRAEKVIGLDTFASDLDKMNKTVSDIYSGWQTAETMGNTLASVKSMQDRVNAYQDYHKQFGEGMDISDVVDYYKNAVDNWQKQTDAYGYYKDKASFDSAMKQSELKKKYAGLTFDQVQSELAKQIKGSDDYNYLSNYTDYADLREYDKALAHLKSTASKVGNIQTDVDWKTLVPQSASTPVKADANVEADWTVIAKQGADYATKGSGTHATVDAKKAQEDWNTLLQPSMDEASKRKYQKELERARNVYALDHTFDYYKDYMDRENFAEKSQYVSNDDEMYEWINNPYSRSSILADKTATTSDGLPVFTLPIAQVSMHTSQLNDDEKAVYNYIYATEGAESANAFLKAMETTLGKRYADTQSAEMEEYVDESEWNGALASVASVPLKLAGAFGTGAELVQSQITGEDYDVYSINNAMTNIATDTRKHVGDNIEEGTELKIGGQNAMRFLYDTGMSMSDSLATMGAVGKATSIVMGTGAFQQTAREMVEAGEDAETTMKMALASGVTEAVFEHIGIDNLFKIKNSDTLANAFKNIMKQAGIEGLEEIGTEFANFAWDDAIRGDNSEIAKMKQELEARGFSESEINTEISKYVVKNLVMAGVGGALSGGVMGGGASFANYASIKSEQRQQKELEQEILTTMQMTPEELEALEAYEKMAGKTSAKGAEITNTSDNQVESNKAELQSIADGMDKAKGELLLAQYDGKTDVESYVNSFNLAYYYGEKGYTQQKMLQMKGALTPRQVSEIYKATVFEGAKRRENAIKAISEKHGRGITVAGKFDDSIINYEKTDVEGKVRWDSLTDTQKSAVRFAQAFSKVTGVNITFTDKGMAEGFNGKYDSDTNTITLDIYAGVDKIEGKNYSDAIIPALSHEMTHWMKAKSPAMYQKMREYALDTLQATTGKNMVGIVDSEMARIREAHPDIKVTEDYAMDEILARACEDMLSNSKKIRELLNTLTEKEQKSFIDHVKEFFQNLKDWVDDLLGQYRSGSEEATVLRKYESKLKELSKMWDDALEQAIQTNQSLQKDAGNEGSGVHFSSRYNDGLAYLSPVERSLYEKMVSEISNKKAPKTIFGERIFIVGGKLVYNVGGKKDNKITRIVGVSVKEDSPHEITYTAFAQEDIINYETKSKSDAPIDFEDIAFFTSNVIQHGYGRQVFIDVLYESYYIATKRNELARERELRKPLNFHFEDEQDGRGDSSESQGTQVKYSDRDSTGNILSEAQIDFFKDSKVRDENGRLKVMYHGTGRADRVGYIFRPDRATSGPMAYFTDNKDIAGNYAKDKADTSIAYDSEYDSYETQFRVERNGKNMSVVELWKTLPMSERNAIKEKAKHITMDDEWENVIYSANTEYGLGNFDAYELNAHRGNALHTLVDSWLTGGSIYGEEHKFLDVLKLVGIEDAKYMNPDFRDEKVYEVYLNITNPFDTSNIPAEILEAFRIASQSAEYGEGNSADMWDKRNIPPQTWVSRLEEDIENDTTHAWTSIPDFVTDVLKEHGYDGIFDLGGKGGGIGHMVVIPFYENQIKDTTNTNPTTNKDIRYSDREVRTLTDEDYSKLKKHFGTTTNFKVAGYMLKDGAMLDFSGKHWGNPSPTSRDVDHRDVWDVWENMEYDGTDEMVNMISNGNIRLVAETSGINLAVAPTQEQRKVLTRYIRTFGGEVVVDIDRIGGDTEQSFQYDKGTSAEKIFADIDNYFRGGRQSDLMRFHTQYSDRNASYKTDRYYSKFTPNTREDAKHTNMLDNRNIARYRKEIDGVFDGTLPTGSDVIIGMPSELLLKYGVSNRPIHMTQRIARKIAYPLGYKIGESFLNEKVTQKTQGDMEGKHNLGISVVKNLPLQISQPIAITKNNKKNRNKNSVILWTNWISEDGKGIMLGLVIDSVGATGLQNNISTVFQAETEYAEQFFENEEDILYTQKNKDIKQLLSDRRYMPKARVDDTFIKNLTEKYPDVKYSDRTTTSIYDTVGELDSLRKQNAKLSADVERLNERLRLEKQVTKGNSFNENQLDAVVRHLKSLAKSDYDSRRLREEIKSIYTYIVQTTDIKWVDLMAQCYDVAKRVLDKQRPTVQTDVYFKTILNDLRKTRISLTEEQLQEAKSVFGNNYRDSFMGKIMIAKDGISLDIQWQEWATMYPEIFDASVSVADQITELYDIYDDVRNSAEVLQTYNTEEDIRAFAYEIYNQYWNVSTIRTTADKYDREIKRLNFEHRKAMSELRSNNKERMESQKKVSREYYGKIIKNLRTQRDTRVKEANARGRAKMAEYKDRVAKNAKIERITKKALTLNEWLVKNSKDEHIPEVMKEPVAYLLNAIDFSSKRLLKGGEETRKDISLSKALEKVHDLASGIGDVPHVTGKDISDIYGTFADFPEGFASDVSNLSKKVNDILREVGDNEYILNQMSLEELESLDKLVTTLKTTVTKMNKFLAIRHAEGVANLSRQSIAYLDELGKGKTHDGTVGKASAMLNWGNALPYYVFKRYGEGGMKVYEALQDGWDKFAFHIKEIIDYSEATYTSKEVQDWEKDIREFDVLEPATDAEKGQSDYEPTYQKVQMSVPQIMSLYCLQKREQARGHLMGGGIRVADIKTSKGVVSQSEGVLLSESELDMIINSLTDKQKEVADSLQRFMNTTCTEWGNEVSMLRFGYKAFGEENYFPIQSDKNNLKLSDETEKKNSLFKLLNMPFTKGTLEKASNRLIISDIFDVFAQHTSDMAKYNALALPVLDAFKWYNYKERAQKGDTQYAEKSLKQSLENALGEDAQSYFVTFMRDINGEKNVGRDTLSEGFFTNAKIASVGFNLKVVALQPTSYLRAQAVIDPKYLAQAVAHKPKTEMAKKYCGIALWKSLGFYDINVQRSVADLIKHDETWKEWVAETSMKGAGMADEITWGYLWNACEAEVRDTKKDLKVGSEEYYSAVSKRLREIIYATQVVDTTMTRSQMMRSSDGRDKILTAFASEPTLSYNMLQGVYYDFALENRRSGFNQAFKKYGRKFARTLYAYTITNALVAILETGFEVFRDEEEKDEEELLKMCLENFLLNQSILNKIPYTKEMISLLQGFTSTRMDTQWMQYFVYTVKGLAKIILEEEGNPYKTARNGIKSMSYLLGTPLFNTGRDIVALLDKTELLEVEELEEMFNDFIGEMYPSLKIK